MLSDKPLGVAQVQRPHRQVDGVAAEVGQAAVAEVEPPAPAEGMIDVFLEGAHGRRPDPQVPVEARRNGIFARGAAFVGVDADAPLVDLADLAQRRPG